MTPRPARILVIVLMLLPIAQALRAVSRAQRIHEKHLMPARRRLYPTALPATKFKNFDEMLTTFPDTVVLVNFYAKWCGPCRVMKKELESVHETLGDTVKIFTVDTEKWPSLGVRYKVQGLPCAMLFKGGKVLHRIDGYESADELVRQIKTFM